MRKNRENTKERKRETDNVCVSRSGVRRLRILARFRASAPSRFRDCPIMMLKCLKARLFASVSSTPRRSIDWRGGTSPTPIALDIFLGFGCQMRDHSFALPCLKKRTVEPPIGSVPPTNSTEEPFLHTRRALQRVAERPHSRVAKEPAAVASTLAAQPPPAAILQVARPNCQGKQSRFRQRAGPVGIHGPPPRVSDGFLPEGRFPESVAFRRSPVASRAAVCRYRSELLLLAVGFAEDL
jgi:hypothetical protein